MCESGHRGGTTPGVELFREIRAESDIDMNVLIRPRFGDFHYTGHEVAIMRREIETFAREGSHGIVMGSLHSDGSLHREQMGEMIAAAGDCRITLHRAFDVCRDPFEVMEQAAYLGGGYDSHFGAGSGLSGRTGHAEASDGESAGRDGYPHWRRGDAGGDPAVSGTDAGETDHQQIAVVHFSAIMSGILFHHSITFTIVSRFGKK